MKKIIRLICVVFLLLFLFYATDYVKECRQMRDVFDSFVVVENPSSRKQCSVINDTLRRDYERLHFMDNPRPVWTDLGGYHVYSAFWTGGSAPYAWALALGPPSRPDLHCSIWFEYENIVSAVRGRLSYESDSRDRPPRGSNVDVYKLTCKVDVRDSRGRPYMLVFSPNNKNSKKKWFIPIFLKTLTGSNSNETAICVRPDPAGTGKADIVEFISFHLLVGGTDLVVYGNDMHNSIVHRMRQLVGASHFLRSVSVLPWNFPYDDPALELETVRTDCRYRTFGLTKAFAVLEWDQYIVPDAFQPILEAVGVRADKSPCSVNTRSQLCCLESVDDKRSEISWPVILKKTYCADYPFDTVVKIHGEQIAGDEDVVPNNCTASISVKTFRSCAGLNNLKTKYDHTPFKFLSGLLSSELLRLWNTGSLF